MNLTREGSTLYVAAGDFFRAQGAPAALAVVDVRAPARPRVPALWRSPEPVNGSAAVAVADRHAFLPAMHHGIMVFDVRDPDRIVPLATFRPDPDFPRPDPGRLARPNARGLAVAGNRLFVAYDAGGLRVLDIADPAGRTEIGRYIDPAIGSRPQAYNNVAIDGTRADVAEDYAGMEVPDVADPARIRALAWWNPWNAHTLRNVWFNSPGHTNPIAYDPASRRVYLSAGDSELLVVDLADAARPTWVPTHEQPKYGRGT